MNILTKIAVTPQDKRQMDGTQAALEKLAANQDYIAMMADIDLEDDEESEVSEDEQ